MFLQACVHRGGGGVSHHAMGRGCTPPRQNHQGRHHLGQTPHCPERATEADGTHPTGMHSFDQFFFLHNLPIPLYLACFPEILSFSVPKPECVFMFEFIS